MNCAPSSAACCSATNSQTDACPGGSIGRTMKPDDISRRASRRCTIDAAMAAERRSRDQKGVLRWNVDLYEGNYSMAGMLRGRRAEEKAVEEQTPADGRK